MLSTSSVLLELYKIHYKFFYSLNWNYFLLCFCLCFVQCFSYFIIIISTKTFIQCVLRFIMYWSVVAQSMVVSSDARNRIEVLGSDPCQGNQTFRFFVIELSGKGKTTPIYWLSTQNRCVGRKDNQVPTTSRRRRMHGASQGKINAAHYPFNTDDYANLVRLVP